MDSKRSLVRIFIPFYIIHLALTFGAIVVLIQTHLSNSARLEKLEANCDCNDKRDEPAQSFKEGNERQRSTSSLQVRRSTILDDDQRASEFFNNNSKAANSTVDLDVEKITGKGNTTLVKMEEHVTNPTKLNEHNITELNENITNKTTGIDALNSGLQGNATRESSGTLINTTNANEYGNSVSFRVQVKLNKRARQNKENRSETENTSMPTIFERQDTFNGGANRSNSDQQDQSKHTADISAGAKSSQEEKVKEGYWTGNRVGKKLKYLKRNVDVLLCLDELKVILNNYVASGSPLTASQGLKGCKVLRGEKGEKGCAGSSFAPPAFQRSPSSVIYDQQDTAVLICIAVANPMAKITWYREGTPITNESYRYRIENRDVTPQASSRAKNCPSAVPHPVIQSSLMINNTNGSDTGTYTCKANNILGASRFEIYALIRVFVKFIQIPSNVTVVQGENVKLSCRASGIPQPKITWYRKDGGPMPSQYNTTEGDLYIVNIKKEEEGAFVCQATNVLGSETTNAAISVNVFPKITSFLNHPITVNESTSLLLPCSATGYPIPDIHWVKSTGSLPKNRHYYDYQLLNVTDAVYEDRGKYVCFANNTVGVVNRSIEVLVQVSPKIIKMAKKYEIGYLSLTKRLDFEVFSIPEAVVLWKRPSWTHQDNERFTIENGTLIIHNVTKTDAGFYQAMAINLLGEVKISIFLGVKFPVAPWVRIIPDRENVPVSVGGHVRKECAAFGQPAPIIHWKFKGRSLINSQSTQSSLTLNISNIQVNQFGSYTCEASNQFGVGSQNFHITGIGITVAVSGSCDYLRIDSTEGYIRSPGYPGNYGNKVNCWCRLTSISRVRLTFVTFDTESKYDKVIVYDGGSISSRKIGEYSGNSIPRNIFSSAKDLYITFSSDGSSTRKGFSAKYQGI